MNEGEYISDVMAFRVFSFLVELTEDWETGEKEKNLELNIFCLTRLNRALKYLYHFDMRFFSFASIIYGKELLTLDRIVGYLAYHKSNYSGHSVESESDFSYYGTLWAF